MRNFWVETEVDGRKTKDATGPQSKTGGFVTRVFVEQDGNSVRKVFIVGRIVNGKKLIEVWVDGLDKPHRIEVE